LAASFRVVHPGLKAKGNAMGIGTTTSIGTARSRLRNRILSAQRIITVAPTEVRRPSHARRGFAISWISATLVTAALVGICFHAEVVAGDEAAQLKQAAESATAELRQSLQREHDRAEALVTELAQARRTMEQEPAGVEEKPAAKQSEGVAAENSKPENKPVETAPLPKRVEHEPRGRALSPNCFYYRTYDPASGTYRSYDGRIRSCR
jgi:hypothetical protein